MGTGSNAATRYAEGADYTVVAPRTPCTLHSNGCPQAIDSRELNLTVLRPFVVD